ncbi:hypothetical protein F8M41_023441 [Gigaspora margarita]|uniref:Uncharacterized protein n=1 Tax=Gigaspora margarita TaxID=4874 RepID=A0A8H4ADE9_GIGMA|nr:hypothetical protein F8M41_023441 [Gigaspora margarita]
MEKLSVNDLQELIATSTFLTELGDDDMIEHSEAETKIEQNLEGINYLNIENIVNLNHNAFQDDEDHKLVEMRRTKEYVDELMIGNNEGQGIFDFDLVNDLEDNDTENIGDSLNTDVHMDDNFDEAKI